jgi:hypothetical protein
VVIVNHIKVTNIEILVLSVLAVLSLSTGYFCKDFFIGAGSNYFNQFIHVLPGISYTVESEFLPVEVKLTPFVLTALAFEIESRFFECKWFYNEAVNGCIALPVLVMSRHVFEQHEKVMLEQNGPLFAITAINSLALSYFKN